MIVFKLACSKDHEFDAWFRDGAAFDAQRAKGAVTCPECGSTDVRKAIMAPRLNRGDDAPGAHRQAEPKPSAPQAVTAATGRQREFVRLMTALREHVEKTCDYVGDKFAEEARRIHYGEVERRDIYGETTLSEAKDLLEEGIEVAPIPGLPRRDS